MKRIILLTATLLFAVGVFAQNYAFINTEVIFRALPEYNSAIEQIDRLAQTYRDQIDAQYDKVAEMYDRYQFQKNNLSENTRRQVEDNIINMEQELEEIQERYFGNDGELMGRRVELLKPIQDKVFNVIDTIAQSKGLDMIIDISNNPSIVYYNKSLDLSEDVVKSLGVK